MAIERLDFKKLRSFQLVAKYGNLRLAARRLRQTIPATSAQLKRLEEELGIALFERLPNRVALTSAGAQFLEDAEEILDRMQRAMARLNPDSIPSGRISISTGVDHAWYFAPRISAFLKRYPAAEFSLQVRPAREAIQGLLHGELDLSLGIFPELPKSLQQEIIVQTSLSLVCARGHKLLASHPPDIEDLAAHTLIVLPSHSDTRKLVDKGLSRFLARPSSIVEVASCQTASTFVELGVGVGIVHSICIEHARPPGLGWVELGRDFGKIPFSAVYRRGRAHTPLVQGLLDELGSQPP